jgi:hypothetical protein
MGARAMLFYSHTCWVRQAVNTDFPMPSHTQLNGLVIRERERARAGSSPLLFLRAAQTKSRRREARGNSLLILITEVWRWHSTTKWEIPLARGTNFHWKAPKLKKGVIKKFQLLYSLRVKVLLDQISYQQLQWGHHVGWSFAHLSKNQWFHNVKQNQ